MTGIGQVVAFVASTDLDRAESFYVGTLGLTATERSPYALVLAGGGSEIRVTLVAARAEAPYTVLGWQVADLDAVAQRLRARGVRFTVYDGMGQVDDVWTAPDGSRIAWFSDPDGNVLSLQEPPV